MDNLEKLKQKIDVTNYLAVSLLEKLHVFDPSQEQINATEHLVASIVDLIKMNGKLEYLWIKRNEWLNEIHVEYRKLIAKQAA